MYMHFFFHILLTNLKKRKGIFVLRVKVNLWFSGNNFWIDFEAKNTFSESIFGGWSKIYEKNVYCDTSWINEMRAKSVGCVKNRLLGQFSDKNCTNSIFLGHHVKVKLMQKIDTY